MIRKIFYLGGYVFQVVFGFIICYWCKQLVCIVVVVSFVLFVVFVDVLMLLFVGCFVDVLLIGLIDCVVVWYLVFVVFGMFVVFGIGVIVLCQGVYLNIIMFMLKMMSEIVVVLFYCVQCFLIDWYVNSFVGLIVCKIICGIWVFDLFNDIVLIVLLLLVMMLVGVIVLFGMYWFVMGFVVGVGLLLYIVVMVVVLFGIVVLVVWFGNLWDMWMGGVFVDVVSCNVVVKVFGVEMCEEVWFVCVIGKWWQCMCCMWVCGMFNGGLQGVMFVVMQVVMIGVVLWLWVNNEVSVGDIVFVLMMFFMLQGYLCDVGMYICNLQCLVNDMEEFVVFECQLFGIDDCFGVLVIWIG